MGYLSLKGELEAVKSECLRYKTALENIRQIPPSNAKNYFPFDAVMRQLDLALGSPLPVERELFCGKNRGTMDTIRIFGYGTDGEFVITRYEEKMS